MTNRRFKLNCSRNIEKSVIAQPECERKTSMKDKNKDVVKCQRAVNKMKFKFKLNFNTLVPRES